MKQCSSLTIWLNMAESEILEDLVSHATSTRVDGRTASKADAVRFALRVAHASLSVPKVAGN